MDIVQDYTRLRHIGTFPQNASKDDTGFCWRYLNGGFDTLESMRSDGIDCRSLDDLQVTQGCEIQAQILQGIAGLVDKEDIYAGLLKPNIYRIRVRV